MRTAHQGALLLPGAAGDIRVGPPCRRCRRCRTLVHLRTDLYSSADLTGRVGRLPAPASGHKAVIVMSGPKPPPPRFRVATHTAAGLLILLAIVALTPGRARAFILPVTGPADAPRMEFDSSMRTASVCLPVTNPAGGTSVLYGRRFTDGPVTAGTPAIVLVHGIASSTEDWDFSPTWSVARALASAGYVVYSYDRLGYAASSYYSQPGGGYSLTTAAHRAMLHDVVTDVHSGNYATTSATSCGPSMPADGYRSAKVVVIGHSAGGWVVSGYPGQYHDVSAMVEADISGSVGGGTSSPLGGNSAGGSFTPDPAHPDYFQFFQTVQDCFQFNTYAPGVVAYAAKIACTPPYLDSPFGEIADLGVKYAQNDAEIAQIGPSIPVLLTSGAQDTTDPPSSAQADYAYYKAHCGCDVSQLLLPDTAHLFQVHRSLPVWVDHVVDWLSARDVAGTPSPANASRGGGTPGARCAPASGRLTARALGPVRLGSTRAALRRRLPHVRSRHGTDVFCLAGGPGIRVGYASAAILRRLTPGAAARIRGRAVIVLTANHHYALRGVRPGMRATAATRRRLRTYRPVRLGANRWYFITLPGGTGVVKVTRGRVAEVGIANRRLSRGARARRRLLATLAGG